MAMTKDDTATRKENISVLQEAFPFLTFEEAFTLQNKLYCIAVRVKHMEARYCNEPNLDEQRTEVRNKARRDAKRSFDKLGIVCDFDLSTDSRGPGLWLHLHTRRYNTMGGEEAGWGY